MNKKGKSISSVYLIVIILLIICLIIILLTILLINIPQSSKQYSKNKETSNDNCYTVSTPYITTEKVTTNGYTKDYISDKYNEKPKYSSEGNHITEFGWGRAREKGIVYITNHDSQRRYFKVKMYYYPYGYRTSNKIVRITGGYVEPSQTKKFSTIYTYDGFSYRDYDDYHLHHLINYPGNIRFSYDVTPYTSSTQVSTFYKPEEKITTKQVLKYKTEIIC